MPKSLRVFGGLIGAATDPVLAPLPVTSGLRFWYAARGINAGNNSLLALWKDKSGNAFNATATGSARATFKTNQVNGQASVEFDGINNFLATVGLNVLDNQNNYTWFMVWKPNSTQNNSFPRPMGGRYEDGGPGVEFPSVGAGEIWSVYRNSGGGFEGTTPRGTVTYNAWQMHDYIKNGTAQEIFKNAASQGTSTAGDPVVLTGVSSAGFQLGAAGDVTRRFKGELAEVIFYNRALTASERASVRAYLETVYAVGIGAVNWNNRTNVGLSGELLTKNGGGDSFNDAIAWQSALIPNGDFLFTWKMPTAFGSNVNNGAGGMVGIKRQADGAPSTAGGHGQLNHAINLNDATFYPAPQSCQAFEAGNPVGVDTTNVFGGETMSIQRVGTTIYYAKNGVIFHTSTCVADAYYLVVVPYGAPTNAFIENARIYY